MNNFIEKLKQEIKTINDEHKGSAWARGVAEYTAELIENIENSGTEPRTFEELRAAMLNGARDWGAYSWGGCSLIYDEDIARTLCTPSELKRTNNGQRNPNGRESWLDVQSRALMQAACRVKHAWLVLTSGRGQE